MICIQSPFKVPVYIPAMGCITEGVLTCMFDASGQAIVEIEGVKYHCVVNQNQLLELSGHAEDKQRKLHAVDAIQYIDAPLHGRRTA